MRSERRFGRMHRRFESWRAVDQNTVPTWNWNLWISIARLGVERNGVAELERADRRVPRDADAGRVAERLELAARVAVGVDLAGVDEHARAHRLVALEDRIEQLDVADDLALAAERVAVDVARAERAVLVAAHRADAAGVERLEERQRLAAVAVAVADVAAQHQHEVAVDRPVSDWSGTGACSTRGRRTAGRSRRSTLCSRPLVG